MAVSPFVRFRGVWNSTFEGGKSGITTLYYAPEQLRSGRKSVAWVHAKRPPRQRVCSSRHVLSNRKGGGSPGTLTVNASLDRKCLGGDMWAESAMPGPSVFDKDVRRKPLAF